MEYFFADIVKVVGEISGEEPEVESAEEYHWRAWRIKTSKFSLIVYDCGNGWAQPLFVETKDTKDLMKEILSRLG